MKPSDANFAAHLGKGRGVWGLLVVVILVAGGFLATARGRGLVWAAYTRLAGRATVEDRVAEYGPRVRAVLRGELASIGASYPPARFALVAFKEERKMQLYSSTIGDRPDWRFLKSYPILGLSGKSGPKLREGDLQVPEGIYKIESLNPNSRFHLALRVRYPNDIDATRAKADGRTQLGGDIMIHGGSASIGCLAMGDAVIEELFVLVADVGVENVEVVIAPRDLRLRDRAGLPGEPAWNRELYDEIEAALKAFPIPGTSR